MITLVSLHDTQSLHNYDLVYVIVRSYKPVRCVNVAIQMAELSPSWELFQWYLKKKKSGKWNEELFQEQYVPRFIAELACNPCVTDSLNKLFKMSQNNNIAVGCYCIDEDTCHRSIVGGILLGAGASICCSERYRRYYDLYTAARQKPYGPLPSLV